MGATFHGGHADEQESEKLVLDPVSLLISRYSSPRAQVLDKSRRLRDYRKPVGSMVVEQAKIVDFLSSPSTYGVATKVDVIETHGAYVFLCDDTALKLKRAVRYEYMDLSTVEKRGAMLKRELQLNGLVAPEIYRDVLPITKEPNGSLALAGTGATVDWVLRMYRFPADHELITVAQRGGLNDHLVWNIGVVLAQYHSGAPVRGPTDAKPISKILNELSRFFAERHISEGTLNAENFVAQAKDALSHIEPLLEIRSNSGHVRRGHGDLHLGNLVLVDEWPVPFDALEFDEALGTCDVLYDLGFLIMDLCHNGFARAACRVLDAWLMEFQGSEDEGLRALPIFLSIRAAIRAMVQLQTDAALGHPGKRTKTAKNYLLQASSFLKPDPPMLVAVGGYSGTGKTLLARGISPGLGAAPGAVVLSSDATRKSGRCLDDDRPFDDYSTGARSTVYAKMFERAHTILAAGHSVVLDATFLDPKLRHAAQQVAEKLDLTFTGFWLEAPRDVLASRIKKRTKDKSDADEAVLNQQLELDIHPMTWTALNADCQPETLFLEARSFCQN